MISRRTGTQYRAGAAVDLGLSPVILGAAAVLSATVWVKDYPSVILGAAATSVDTTVVKDSPSVILGAAAVVAPSQVQGLNASLGQAFWYDAAQGTTINVGVQHWADLSGNGHTLNAVGDSTTEPALNATAGPDGGPCLVGDGINDGIARGFVLAQPAHVWLVAKFDAVSSGTTIMDGATTVNHGRVRSEVDGVYFTAGAQVGPLAGTQTVWRIYEMQWNNASFKARVGSGTYLTGTIGTNDLGGITLFQDGKDTGEAPAAGKIAGLIGFSSIQSTDMIANILSALQSRFNL
ncbi:MAG: hypothetical protein KGL39_18030 [Patescibacteria group bacterium]|nr:hypothetical protein [Patescibacteria group bacterium]